METCVVKNVVIFLYVFVVLISLNSVIAVSLIDDVEVVGDIVGKGDVGAVDLKATISKPIDLYTSKIGVDKYRWSSEVQNIIDVDNSLKSCDDAVSIKTDQNNLYLRFGKEDINISYNYASDTKVLANDINFSVIRNKCSVYFTHNIQKTDISNLTYVLPQGASYVDGKIIKGSIEIDLEQAQIEQNIDIKQVDSKTLVFSGENITKLDPTVSFNGTNHSSLRIYWGDGCTTPQPITTYPLTCGTVTDISSSTAFDAINTGEFRYVENTAESNYVFADANVSFLVNGNYIINNFTWTVSGRSVSVGDNFKDNIYLYKYDTSTWEKRANIWNTSGAAYQEVILVNSSTSTYLGLENMTIFVGSNTTSFPSAAVDWIGLQIDYTVDSPPNAASVFWVNGSNKTQTVVGFNFTGYDVINLSYWVFGNNQSGSWVNSSPSNIFVNNLNGSYNFNLSSSTRGKNVCTEVYYNDTSNQWNSSGYICFDVKNTAPTLNESESLYNLKKSHGTDFMIDFNSSDADGDSPIEYFINDTSIFSINKDSGILTGNPGRTNEGNYSILLNVSDRYSNTSLPFWINITNSIPSLSSAVITPDPATDVDNLVCTPSGYSDTDGDTIVQYWIKWLKNGVPQNTDNVTVLNAGNTTNNDLWSCVVTPFDGTYNGTNASSQIVNIGSSFSAPVITFINASSVDTRLNSTLSFPTTNISQVNLSVNFTDGNSNELFTAYFCKNNTFNNGCSGSFWGVSSPSNSSSRLLSTNFSVSGLSGVYDYYVFVVDNNSLVSGSMLGQFHVNTPPSFIGFNTSSVFYSRTNKVVISLSGSDVEDSYNFSIYNSSTTTYSYYQSVTTQFSLLNMPEGNHTYYTKVVDQHNYNSTNSTTQTIIFDYTNPTLTLSDPAGTYGLTGITIQWNTNDINIATCSYNISLQSNPNNLQIANTNVTCSSGIDTASISTIGSFNANFCSWDYAGNQNCTSTTFTTTSGAGGATGGGGGGQPLVITSNKKTCNLTIIPNDIIVKPQDKLVQLILKNNENYSITPTFAYDSAYFDLSSIPTVIGAKSNDELILINKQINNISYTKTLVFSTPECAEASFPVKFEGTDNNPSTILNNIEKFFIGSLFSKVKLWNLTIRFYLIVLSVFAIFSWLIFTFTGVNQTFFTKLIGSMFVTTFISTVLYYVLPKSEIIDVQNIFLGRSLSILGDAGRYAIDGLNTPLFFVSGNAIKVFYLAIPTIFIIIGVAVLLKKK